MIQEIFNNDLCDTLYEEDDEDTLKDKYLLFQIGDVDHGIEIRFVLEIIGVQKITDVPDMPEYMKGVINLRGKVIPVIDIRSRFNLSVREYDDRTCIIVTYLNSSTVGLIVDSVSEVIEIDEKNISPPPNLNKGHASKFLIGLGKVDDDVKILLDIDRLLSEGTII